MILLYVPVAAAYLVAAWIEWRRLTGAGSGETALFGGAATWLPPIAIIGHAALLDYTLFTPDGLDLSLVNALSAVEWIIAVVARGWARARERCPESRPSRSRWQPPEPRYPRCCPQRTAFHSPTSPGPRCTSPLPSSRTRC